MNLNVQKDKRSIKYFQKVKGFASEKARRIASLDISKECGKDKFYSKNYISLEYIVLIACSCRMDILSVNTNYL